MLLYILVHASILCYYMYCTFLYILVYSTTTCTVLYMLVFSTAAVRAVLCSMFLAGLSLLHVGVNCYMPSNGETIAVGTTPSIPVDMSTLLFKRALDESIGK